MGKGGTKMLVGVQPCTLNKIWGTNGVQVSQIYTKLGIKTKEKRAVRVQLSFKRNPLFMRVSITY